MSDDVASQVAGVSRTGLKRIFADKYLAGLVREEAGGRRIYHSILSDYILWQMSESEKQEYHRRAVAVYRGKLAEAKKKQTKPDGLSALRLAEHVLACEGEEGFVDAFVNECFRPLLNLGLLDAAVRLSERALEVVEKGSKWEAMLRGNLGLIYRMRGELDKAEEMHKKALEIDEKLGLQEGMASDYGNLGAIYQTRGELDKAEEMHKKSLSIEKKLGRLEGMASDYANLGVVCEDRGDLDGARRYWEMAVDLYKRIGMPHRVEEVQGWIDGLGEVPYRHIGSGGGAL